MTGQIEAQAFQNTAENKLKQIAMKNSMEFGWSLGPMQSLRGDSALESTAEREIVLCKALCPVQQCVGRSVQ